MPYSLVLSREPSLSDTNRTIELRRFVNVAGNPSLTLTDEL